MSESIKTLMVVAAIVAALEALKWTLGTGVALMVAVAALAFCIGAFWGAGDQKKRTAEREDRA